MAVPYPTKPAVTEDALWAEICVVAHGGAGTGLLVREGNGWRLSVDVTPSLKAMADLFLPLLVAPPADRPLVFAHLAQTLDGRIAREDGESHWITGDQDLDHTHRLRAISDAVLVGAETVVHDDCRLTVRRCSGPQPVRVILDPSGRVPTSRKVFSDGAAPTLWICAEGAQGCSPTGVDCVQLPVQGGAFATHDVLTVLQSRGLHRVFVEGGGRTVGHLLKADVVDRLHLAVAPMLMGEGRNTLGIALADGLANCPRPQVTVYPLGSDWIFDCDFRGESQ